MVDCEVSGDMLKCKKTGAGRVAQERKSPLNGHSAEAANLIARRV